DGDSVPRQHLRYPADAADVRVPVFLAEAQALAEVRSHDVAVELLELRDAALPQQSLERVGDGRLAGARKPRKPDRESSLFQPRVSLLELLLASLRFCDVCGVSRRRPLWQRRPS